MRRGLVRGCRAAYGKPRMPTSFEDIRKLESVVHSVMAVFVAWGQCDYELLTQRGEEPRGVVNSLATMMAVILTELQVYKVAEHSLKSHHHQLSLNSSSATAATVS